MVSHVLHALADAGVDQAVVVVPPGKGGEQIRETLADEELALSLNFAVQEVPRGTADAVLAARAVVSTSGVLVVNGDLPMITGCMVRALLMPNGAEAVIATAMVEDPAKMGRIVRDAHGDLQAIVEIADADDAIREIREVNLGLYLFQADFLWNALEHIVSETPAASEAYATDAIPCAVQSQSAVAVQVELSDGRLNVETPTDAANAETLMRRRIVKQLLDSGVHIRDRDAVWIDAGVTVQPGAIIEPGCHLRGRTTIGSGSRVGPNAIIEDTRIGEACVLESCTIRGSNLENQIEVGPYSTIRPGCVVGSCVHIGTHAELKESQIAEHVQIGHFSYIGDAEVGPRTNIGAGAITCNFDGEVKHRTIIGSDVFIGSDTMLIAPLRLGDRARTGAGSVVNKDVPEDAIAVGHPARLRPSRRSREEAEQSG
jgi:bifunctional UDP-N-acetylglucosamine pyrophosphorylase/glucosamine-1-phosphate N-acetyltransferase